MNCHAWDSLNKLLRLQLPDLKDDEASPFFNKLTNGRNFVKRFPPSSRYAIVEQQLTEFFLANIEMRVIEALLMTQISQGLRIPVRFTDLTQLSPNDAYTVLSLRQRADIESPHSEIRPADMEVVDFETHDACALLQVIYSDPSLILTDVSRRPTNISTRLRSAITDSLGVKSTNAREVPVGLAVTLLCSGGPTSSTDAGILVKSSTGQVTPANSVVVTLPASSLKILFCDDPEAELRKHDLQSRNCDITSSQPLLSLYLPHQFRLAVVDFSSPQPLPGRLSTQSGDKITHLGKTKEDQGARTITVTLVYPRPWWRERLAESLRNCADSDPSRWIVDEPKPEPQSAGEPLDAIGGQTAVPELFSILPKSRNERGFCHTFRDLKPQLTGDDTIGLLQTQLFGSAAENWWDAGAQKIANEVHCHLARNLCSFEGGAATDTPDLLTFNVSKWALDVSTPTNNLEPQLEVISKDDILVDARVPVLISPTTRRTDVRRDVSDLLSNEVATGLDLAELALSRPPFQKGSTAHNNSDVAFEKWSSR
ncbi:unnamed protein product, partial [Dibothriocephalus latus]